MFDLDKNNKVILKPEMLLIKVYKEVNDKYSLEEAYNHFAYVFFKHDFKSRYRDVYDGDELDAKIREEIIGNLDWVPGDEITELERIYKELQNVKSLQTLYSAEKALAQVSKYFDEFDVDELPDNTKHSAVNNVMKNLKELSEVVDQIGRARTRVEKELQNKSLAGKRRLGKRELPPSQR